MFHRERVEKEYDRLYANIGLGTTIWSPLASGILTGKYNNGIPQGSRMDLPDYAWLRKALEGEEGKRKIEKVKALEGFAKELGTTLPRLAVAWCAANPNVSTVILGASKPEQLEDTLKSMEVIPKLTASMLNQIEKILNNKPEPAPVY